MEGKEENKDRQMTFRVQTIEKVKVSSYKKFLELAMDRRLNKKFKKHFKNENDSNLFRDVNET